MRLLAIIGITLLLFGCGKYAVDRSVYLRGGEYDISKEAASAKCFAKCLIGDNLKIEAYEFYGTDRESEWKDIILDTSIIQSPETSKWVKKKAKKNCISHDPNDCLVWCLEKVPASEQIIVNEVESDLPKNSRLKTTSRLILNDVKSDEFEVVCDKYLTTAFFRELDSKLLEKGYDAYDNGRMERSREGLRNALIHYQLDNELPVGNFDVFSMESLGILIGDD